jgi:hypothetical protein
MPERPMPEQVLPEQVLPEQVLPEQAAPQEALPEQAAAEVAPAEVAPGEIALPGGFASVVVRAGDTVRRTPGPNAGFVHALLGLLGEAGWGGAPRFEGYDEKGRETLTFLDGHVAWAPEQPAAVRSAASLAQVARLVRQFRDLTAGTALAGDQEVVCHNDLSPKNTVYRDAGAGMRPAAFIDWDIATPGARIHDVAHVCWQYLDLGPGVSDLARTAGLLRLICDAYGLAGRPDLLDAILWWQDRCWRGILVRAAAGDLAMIRLRDTGIAGSVRESYEWVAHHRAELAARL